LTDGTIRLAFRRWNRAQVVAGRRYRSPIGMIEINAISAVAGTIPPEDARAAGYTSVAEMLEDLKGPTDATLYRLELRRSIEADPRSVLATEAELDQPRLAELQRKLARLDASLGRPWTQATLEAIEAHPAVRAGDLYPQLGWADLAEFKLHVRKLKALGLTLSLRVGYELSARGKAYLYARHGGERP
jgi:hypothetical protein